MAITDSQKIDYLWKKIGFSATKTDTSAVKDATNEAIPSPLQIRADKVMTSSADIPGVIPGANTSIVTVYTTSLPFETTNDATASTNRTWKTNLTDWIGPEFGSTYQVKVYVNLANSAGNAATAGTQIYATGSGNNDEWFFDYQSGVLHFIGTNLPNGVSFTGKSVYVSGARYVGTFGVSNFGNSTVGAYLTTYNGNIAVSNITVSSFANITSGITSTSTTTGALILTGQGGAGIGGNLNVGGNVSASYLTATNGIFGTIITATQPNITTVGALLNLAVSGNVDTNILNASRIFYSNLEVLTTASNISFTGDFTGSGANANVYVTLVTTGVAPGIYGSPTAIPVLTIDTKGRVTSATSTSPQFTGNLNFGNTTISTGVGNITLTTTNGGNIILNATGQGVVQIQGNDAVGLPSGNTATRPTSPLTGYFRFNTDNNNVEFYDGSTWASPASNIANTISSQILATDGVSNTFPLASATTSESVLVIINGTIQQPNIAYVVDGANITFSEVPNTTDTVEVRQIAQGTAAVTALNLGTTAGVTLSTGNLNIKGNLIPTTDILYDIGSSSYRWRDLYLSGASIKLGNVILKESNGNLRLRNATDTADAFLEATSTSSATFESLSKNISSYPFSINRTGAVITSVEYTTPSGVITKAFTYIDGQITQIDISGIPLGASTYTKTLSYVNGEIQGASYSTS